jgi:dephospho-CoA kinase
MMISVGLTGSIATGKSEVAKLFSAAGVPVFDSDAEVHSLYAKETTRDLLGSVFPDVIVNGRIDRQLLGQRVLGSPDDLRKLESLIHPLVRNRRERFIAHWRKQGSPLVVLDIPLLLETGQEKEVDYVIAVSANEEIQRKRAMARPGMTEEKFASILARQLPDVEKRRRADFVIENSGSMEHLRTQVDALSRKLAELARTHKP